jgi:transcription elongation GreA/GreB family factor
VIYYFLKEDFIELDKRINELNEKIRKISLEIGKDAQEDRGIFTYEEGERQKYMWSTRLRELIRIKNNAKIIEPDIKVDKVSLGRCVTIIDEETGSVQKYSIGSYMVLIEKENVIAYNTCLARLLIGAQVGEVRSGEIAGKKRNFRVLKID